VFGYRAIPNGFAFSRDGTLIGSKITGFDVREAPTRDVIEGWLANKAPGMLEAAREPAGDALDLFADGSRLMREGRRDEALSLWAQAYEQDPGNFVIRKQIWRALYPERFGDPIDMAWQKEQMAREAQLGFRRANALP
jgi:tetratricopeptide (TPR) repeat protein